MLIIGIIGAIALPRFAQANARQQLAAAANRVASDLEKARHQARASSNLVTMSFDTAGNSYSYATAAEGNLFDLQLDASPYQIELANAVFDGGSTVSFNGFGIPNTGGTITLESSSGTVTITLNASGSVSR